MHSKPIVFLLLAACCSPLIAAPGETSAKTSTANALVTVNGETVSKELYAAYYKNRHQEQPAAIQDSEQQLAILNELVNFVLLAQDAVAQGLDQRPQVAAELELARSRLLANAAIGERLSSQPISEAALRQAYDEKITGQTLNEYKVSHILLESEQAAGAIIAALDSGETFASQARQHSRDTSAETGGQLGWLSPGQTDPGLNAALKNMAVGEYSKRPVKSEFGWHLLLLEQIRPIVQPGYGEMRASLLQWKQKQLLTTYIKELRTKAQLELNAVAGNAEETDPPAAAD